MHTYHDNNNNNNNTCFGLPADQAHYYQPYGPEKPHLHPYGLDTQFTTRYPYQMTEEAFLHPTTTPYGRMTAGRPDEDNSGFLQRSNVALGPLTELMPTAPGAPGGGDAFPKWLPLQLSDTVQVPHPEGGGGMSVFKLQRAFDPLVSVPDGPHRADKTVDVPLYYHDDGDGDEGRAPGRYPKSLLDLHAVNSTHIVDWSQELLYGSDRRARPQETPAVVDI